LQIFKEVVYLRTIISNHGLYSLGLLLNNHSSTTKMKMSVMSMVGGQKKSFFLEFRGKQNSSIFFSVWGKS